MADEARIVFELRDEGGNAVGTAYAPSPGATGVPPGSNIASDFQQQLTQRGAGANLGVGSNASLPAAATPIYSTAQTPSPVVGGDPLLNAARQILEADTKTTREELQAALGIQSTRAQSLIDAIVSGQKEKGYTTGTEPTTAKVQVPPIEVPRGQPEVARPPEFKPPQFEPIQPYSPFESVYDPFDIVAGQTLPDLEGANRLIQNAQSLNPPPPPPREDERVNPVAIGNIIRNATSAGASLAGPYSPLAQTAVGVGGNIYNAAVQMEAAPGILAAAGPAVAAGAGALALTTAAGYAMVNEAERAVALSRFSPVALQASAQASVRQLLADMRTSERLGDEAAAYVESRSRISTATQGIRDIWSEVPLQKFNSLLNSLGGILERVRVGWDMNTEALKGFQDAVIGRLPEWLERKFGLKSGVAMPSIESLLGISTPSTPIKWFQDQEMLEPPPPFSSSKPLIVGKPGEGTTFAPVAGLSLP